MSLLRWRAGLLLSIAYLAACGGTTERNEEASAAGAGAAGASGSTESSSSGTGNASSGTDVGSGGAPTSSSSNSASGGAEASPCNGLACGASCITEAGEGVCDAEGNCSIDAPVVCGCGSELCQLLDDGVWLVGWAGGLNHFSWLRFQYLGTTNGTVDLLALTCAGCTSFYPCDGQGQFTLDPATAEMVIDLPVACAGQATLVFGAFYDVEWPMGTLTGVEVTDGMYPIEGYLFPPGQCDPAFTSCTDPFQ